MTPRRAASGRWSGGLSGAIVPGALVVLAGCGQVGFSFGNPGPGGVAPVVTRLYVLPNLSDLGPRAPIEILAYVAGQGPLLLEWDATGGVLSVASQSLATPDVGVRPAYAAWQPPGGAGRYTVGVRVTDLASNSTRAALRFGVDRDGVRRLDERAWPQDGSERFFAPAL